MYAHHDKKGLTGDRDHIDRGAGSGVLARDYDAAIYMARHAADDKAIVLSFRCRNYQDIEPFAVRWDMDRFCQA